MKFWTENKTLYLLSQKQKVIRDWMNNHMETNLKSREMPVLLNIYNLQNNLENKINLYIPIASISIELIIKSIPAMKILGLHIFNA